MTFEERLEVISRKKRLNRVELTEEETKILEAKWKGRSGPSLRAELPDLEGITLDTKEHDPKKIVCSFCGKDISRIAGTRGNGPTRIIVQDELEVVDGVKTLTSKVKVTSPKVVACHECCLKVKKTEFPSYE